jgi:hypothetical protein
VQPARQTLEPAFDVQYDGPPLADAQHSASVVHVPLSGTHWQYDGSEQMRTPSLRAAQQPLLHSLFDVHAARHTLVPSSVVQKVGSPPVVVQHCESLEHEPPTCTEQPPQLPQSLGQLLQDSLLWHT